MARSWQQVSEEFKEGHGRSFSEKNRHKNKLAEVLTFSMDFQVANSITIFFLHFCKVKSNTSSKLGKFFF
jgi:hypothetical protein